jgi:hypothetical protein
MSVFGGKSFVLELGLMPFKNKKELTEKVLSFQYRLAKEYDL